MLQKLIKPPVMERNVHHYQDIINIFNCCFLEDTNTQLCLGADEPLYLPASESLAHNTIYFAHGYFASALHECSHWLIAGLERRKQVDYGYWYEPDGRTAEQQAMFQRVESKPQALEWILSKAAQFRFRISLDNLNNVGLDAEAFKHSILEQVKVYCEKGLSSRAEYFRRAICQFYRTSCDLVFSDFDIDVI